MAYQPIPIREEGGENRALTSDERVIQLLIEAVTILRKVEYHLMLATDTELKDQDVGG